MKKTILITITVFCIIIVTSFYIYYSYQSNINKIAEANRKYEKYDGKSFRGTELISIINQIVDDNTRNNIKKNEKDEYIENDTNSIKADIYFKDNNKTYLIETIYSSGIENFAKSYSSQAFKCTEIEYHSKTKLVKYIHFEQI